MALKPVARVGDFAQGTCTAHRRPVPWSGPITTSSCGFTVDGIPAAGVGDVGTTSCGHNFIISGGSSILTGLGVAVARLDDPVLVIQGGSGVNIAGSSTTTSE